MVITQKSLIIRSTVKVYWLQTCSRNESGVQTVWMLRLCLCYLHTLYVLIVLTVKRLFLKIPKVH